MIPSAANQRNVTKVSRLNWISEYSDDARSVARSVVRPSREPKARSLRFPLRLHEHRAG